MERKHCCKSFYMNKKTYIKWQKVAKDFHSFLLNKVACYLYMLWNKTVSNGCVV